MTNAQESMDIIMRLLVELHKELEAWEVSPGDDIEKHIAALDALVVHAYWMLKGVEKAPLP